jgi:predicted dehydrogenase
VDQLGVGVIGCGNMGGALARACARLPAARIVAVSDPVKERAEALAGELGASSFDSTDGLLHTRHVDAVIVASPGFLHEEHAVQAASAGKHVFCEKPMALSVASCDRMITEASAHHVKLMVGQVLRYVPLFAQIKELVRDTLGQPVSMQITRISEDWGVPSPWRFRKDQSGGILYEVSVHELDFMRYVAGDVDQVAAYAGQSVRTSADYEDSIQVLVHFGGGGHGSLFASRAASMGAYHGTLLCVHGTLFLDSAKGELRYRVFDDQEVVLGPQDMPTEPPIERELRYFVECVLNDTTPAIPGEEGRKAVQIIEAAYLSAQEGRMIRVPAL